MIREKRVRISVFLILISEVLPLKIIGLPPPFEFNQLLYVVSFFLTYNRKTLVSFITNSIFLKLFVSYFLFLILHYVIGNYYKDNLSFNFPLFNAVSVFIILYVFYQVRSWIELKRLSNLFMLVLFFEGLFGLLVFVFGEPFASIRMTLGGYSEGFIYYGKGDPIPGLDPTVFMYAYPVVILPIVSLASFSIKRNNLYLYSFVFSLLIVVLNSERIVFGAVFLMVLTLLFKLKIKIKLGTIILGTLLFLLVFNSFSENLLSESSGYSRVVSSNNDIANRFFKMHTAIETVLNCPLTGGTAQDYINRTYRGYGFSPSSVHNTYIAIARNSGVLGFMLFLIAFFFIFRLIRKIKKQVIFNEKNLFYGYIYSFIAVLLVGFFHNAGLFTREPFTWILLGFIISFNSVKKFSMNKKSRNY